MAIPDFQTLMLPLLRLAAQGEIKSADSYEKLADEFHLSAAEREQLLPSGQQTVVANRVGWARTFLYKAGLLERSQRGQYRITERGKTVLNENPPRIDNRYLSRFSEFVAFRGGRAQRSATGTTEVENDEKTPDEVIRAAHAELENALGQELLARILDKSPAFFERLVVQLMVAMGYGGSLAEAGRALGEEWRRWGRRRH